jgi:hypothetical protein
MNLEDEVLTKKITDPPFYSGPQYPDAIPYTDKGSAHIDDARGRRISPSVLQPIFDKLNIGTHADWLQKCSAKGLFNAGIDKGKMVTYNVMHLVAKFLLLNPSVFKGQGDCPTECSDPNKCPCFIAGKCYGRAKYYAIKDDSASLRRLLTVCGGNAQNIEKLTDKELIDLWSINEHLDIHCCGFGAPEFFHAVHATSLNDCGDKDSCKEAPYIGGRHEDNYQMNGPVGGFNDKGNYEQWPWWYYAQKTLSFFDVPH